MYEANREAFFYFFFINLSSRSSFLINIVSHLFQHVIRFTWKLFKYFIYLFLERGREGEREGEKHQCVVASCTPTTGDPARNPGMCPDWESNQ